MIDDPDKLIEGLSQALSKAITTALRDLIRGLSTDRAGGRTPLELPTGGGEAPVSGVAPGVAVEPPVEPRPPLTLPGKAPPAQLSDAIGDTFASLPMGEVDLAPIASGKFTPQYVMPPEFFAATPEHPPSPVMPPLTMPTRPFAEPPISTPTPHPPLGWQSTIDMKRGFSVEDPTGRIPFHQEQDAQANRYDITMDMLYESMVRQSRIDHDYRQRVYELNQRILRDTNNDYRRIDDLERRGEGSRENITDANI